MRKHLVFYVLIVALMSSIIIFTGCDLYYGKRPSDFSNVIWVSEDSNLWFRVPADDEQEIPIFGELKTEDKIYNIRIGFDNGRGIMISDADESIPYENMPTEDLLVWEDCKFGNDNFVISIPHDSTNKAFDSDVRKIKLYKRNPSDDEVINLTPDGGVVVLRSSEFVDMQFEKNEIILNYSITLRNNTNIDRRVTLTKDAAEFFHKGADGQYLIDERYLIGKTDKGNETFVVYASDTITYNVAFIGAYSGNRFEPRSGEPFLNIIVKNVD